MNKTQAREIAESGVTIGQLKDMLRAAYEDEAPSKRRSIVNAGMSKGAVFNILWKGFATWGDDTVVAEVRAAVDALREFGGYWEGEVPVKSRRVKTGTSDYSHQEPIDIYQYDG